MDRPLNRLPARLDPSQVTAVIDTREQCPFFLSPLQTVRRTLDLGDYSVAGLEHSIRIERKSLPDLLQSATRDRKRFDREMERLRAFQTRALVVEATWQQLEQGQWRNRVSPAAIIGSCLGWIADGIPIVMAGDHERAGRYAARLLYIAARRRFNELRALGAGVITPRAKR